MEPCVMDASAPRTQSATILLACQCARYFGAERPVWVPQTLIAALAGPSYLVIRLLRMV